MADFDHHAQQLDEEHEHPMADFDLNEPIEDDNIPSFDLNLPLDEHGDVSFDFVQNLADDGVKAPVEVHQRRKEMPEELRKQVYQVLLGRSKNGKLGKKDIQIVGDQFDLHVRSVQRIWKRGKIQLANSVLVVVSSLKKGRVVRKKFMLIWKLCVTFL
ncbi:uncharacterized protein LOC120676144 [Panicum virgatum]|uniref:uncharacterized protein LOC120676144 n=1 Tax=Panicum virgatum TaxID=38727 RepID=UPI0019D60586|nr:uncharacterized protein LOC120676144 [Panicum virgatum]